MSEYWKSAPRHYCEVCKVWLSGHPRNVAAHEASDGHASKKKWALFNMEKKKKEEREETAETMKTIRMIEASAKAAMAGKKEKDVVPANEVPLKPFQRYSQWLPPPRDELPKELRPLEQKNIAEFIAKRLGQRNEITNAAIQLPTSSQFEWEKEEHYYEDIESIPQAFTESEAFRTPRCWTAGEDQATQLPIWSNAALAIKVWEEPPCLKEASVGAEGPMEPSPRKKAKVTKDDEAGRFVGLPVPSVQAGIPGAWEVVKPEDSVFGDNVGHTNGSSRKDKAAADTSLKLDDFLETKNERPDRAVAVGDALEAHDLELAERQTYKKEATGASSRGKIGFKKRGFRPKEETDEAKDGHSNNDIPTTDP